MFLPRSTVLALATVAALSACGGGSDGRPLFERAERALARADAMRVQLRIGAPVSLDRTATIDASDVPFERLHLTRWVEHPRRVDCGDGLECARGDVDVDTVVRELEDLLPPLPVDPRSLDDAHVTVRLDGDELRRVDLDGEAYGVTIHVDLRPVGGA